jgi:AcrR family transcriptional regulator
MDTLSHPPPTEERKGERTRAAILEAAAGSFRQNGFEATTLAGIADQLGITRSAVLHHFRSKDSLLQEVVRPFMDGLDRVLDDAAAAGKFSAPSRRRFVIAIVDLVAAHRNAIVLLTRDISVHSHLPEELQLANRIHRFVGITTEANEDHPHALARSLAAIGSVMRPVGASDDLVDLDDPATRAFLVSAAMAVLKVPLPVLPKGSTSRNLTEGS